MAALVLSVAGGAAGGLFGPIGAFAGRLAGAVVGNILDRSLLSSASHKDRNVEGPRLADLDVMASTEGAPIPRIYGRARLSGQLIWATQLEEVVTRRVETTNAGGGGKGGGFGGGGGGTTVTTTTTTYSYFANFAIGLCEGPIGRVGRVWADGKLLDLSGMNVRVHRGTEDQTPDDLIIAKEGAGHAPAYRGLAYIVFERLPLAGFGNRIPQMSFEIVRPIGQLEQMTRAVTLIPGTTEFGYQPSTVVRVLGPGQFAPENRHVANAASDVMASLDDLQAMCPNLERVAIVVAWFGNDLRAGECKLRPCVDSTIKQTHGAEWSVAGLARANAYAVSSVEGRPAFGGTPSDASVIALIVELKARDLKVTLYPFVMMDIPAGNTLTNPWTGIAPQPAYPWRGRITCDPAPSISGLPDGTLAAQSQVDEFFDGAGPSDWTYRRMILHYANLAAQAGGVDAFLIGSELKALTRVRASSGVYPAVTHLATLASEVKAILGASCTLTYGADWTEYGAHVVDSNAQEVRFPLDPLWASAHIDAIGIDYYAPLSDWRDNADHLDAQIASTIHARDYLAGNLRAGEAYDWYYADTDARAAQARLPISDSLSKPWTFRQKDLWAWWGNAHFERVGGAELGSATAWVPGSKPIWLTEAGCPAVDKGANQPSVFPDPKSSEAGLPHFSNGRRDDLIQRRYIEAVLAAFDPAYGADDNTNPNATLYAGRMIEPSAIHLWAWDARPYPHFPADIESWSDGGNWEAGHWLNGRFGSAPLNELVTSVLSDCGVNDAGASDLGLGPDGYVVDRPMTARAMIEPLAQAYAFDAQASAAQLEFRSRGGAPVIELQEDDLVLPERGALSRLTRGQETELPREVSFGFTDAGGDYRRAAVLSRRLVGGAARSLRSDFSLIMDDGAAAQRAEIWLQDIWAGRESVEFSLPLSKVFLVPGDVVALTLNARRRLFEIQEIVDTQSRRVKARSIDPEIFAHPLEQPQRQVPSMPPALGPVNVELLDLPLLDSTEPAIVSRAALFADPWPGAVAIWRSVDGQTYTRQAMALAPSIMGETLDAIGAGPTSRWDRATRFRVQLYSSALTSALTSVSDARVLDGANVAAIRNEDGAWEIIQFAHAELVAPQTYELSRLLRGQGGTEYAVRAELPAGAPFVLLDDHVIAVAQGANDLERDVDLRIVAAGRAHDDVSAIQKTLTPKATAFMPLSPVHIKATRTSEGVELSWIRRTRRDGDAWAGEVPLNEAGEQYEVDILSGDVVKRSLTSVEPRILYAAADELADFGAVQTDLSIDVYQTSQIAGRGFPAHAELHL